MRLRNSCFTVRLRLIGIFCLSNDFSFPRYSKRNEHASCSSWIANRKLYTYFRKWIREFQIRLLILGEILVQSISILKNDLNGNYSKRDKHFSFSYFQKNHTIICNNQPNYYSRITVFASSHHSNIYNLYKYALPIFILYVF